MLLLEYLISILIRFRASPILANESYVPLRDGFLLSPVCRDSCIVTSFNKLLLHKHLLLQLLLNKLLELLLLLFYKLLLHLLYLLLL